MKSGARLFQIRFVYWKIRVLAYVHVHRQHLNVNPIDWKNQMYGNRTMFLQDFSTHVFGKKKLKLFLSIHSDSSLIHFYRLHSQ